MNLPILRRRPLAVLAALAVSAAALLAPLQADAAQRQSPAGREATAKAAVARPGKAPRAAKAVRPAYVPVHASVLMDARTGAVLRAENADAVTYPASLTKMMTVLMAFEAIGRGELRLDQEVPVSRRAAGQKPSCLGVVPGTTARVEDLILALTVKSANDAAAVLAEAMGGDESRFAEAMTARARALGMTRTTFRNASGLPDREQRTTARDMAILARAVTRLPPHQYAYFGRTKFEWGGSIISGHNRLLGRVEGYDGIKTGFINLSGFNLAGSAVRDGRRLIAVVLGGTTARVRDAEVAALLEEGFARTRAAQTASAAAAVR